MKKTLFLMMLLFVSITTVMGQVFSNKVVGKNKEDLKDSLKVSDYPYLLPIGGEQVVQMGFDLPYSAGLSVQYINQKSDLILDNLMIGFNHGEMFGLEEILQFNEVTASTNGMNFRPDVWVLPFLNVYGIFARSTNQTNVDFGVYLPGNFNISDGNLDWSWEKAFDMQTEATFEATTFGFGMTPTVGVGGGFFALDMNWTWSDIPELDKPASIFVFGPRLGKSFHFGKPEQNLSVWVGGFRVKMGSSTKGSLEISELFPDWDDKISTGLDKVEEGQQHVNDWWNELPSGIPGVGQNNPVNKAKKAAADKAFDIAGTALDAASRAESVQYSLEKRQANMWNFLIGSQYQLNKHFMVRAEFGILGTRQQFIGGLQYRFGL
ncbi:hypothetical protein [Carboxylicivirga sp. RSCT41]|uniref:hypothetical protein n=1 Tax=Carboxylicivirga agarovorans TaxID=3417570 RepID=UPI003D34CDED